jgi:site-specific recombinase XerD
MSTPLSVTTAQRIAAQRTAYRYYLARDKFRQDNVSIHLLPPMALAEMLNELEELRAEVEELRAFKFDHPNP